MANPRRGEAELRLGGRSYRLRVTLNALAETEAALGADGLPALARRLAEGAMRSADLLALLGAAMRAGGTPLSDMEAGELVTAPDLPRVAEALGALMAAEPDGLVRP
jgi:hypothetical protein